MVSLTTNGIEINDEARPLLVSIAEKQKIFELSHPEIRVLGRTATQDIIDFSDRELSIIDTIPEIDAESFNIFLPNQGSDVDASTLVAVRGQKIIRRGIVHTVGDRYTTPEVLHAFTHMSDSMKRKLGRPLIIQTGYRSPTYQALLFARQLVENEYDLDSTIHEITLPGRSEHANITSLATDIMPFSASTHPYNFEETPEYEWMQDNAELYDFHLSYPVGNPANMMFEPWHWIHKTK